MSIETRIFINGEFQPSSDGVAFDLVNHFTRESVAQDTVFPMVSQAGEEDVNKAVVAAKAAFPTWRDLSPSDRGAYLLKLSALIRETYGEFARLESLSTGKPYGVVACIFPWNVPMAFFAFKAVPALAAGNTVVLKSSEKAPLTIDRKGWFPTGCDQQHSGIPYGCPLPQLHGLFFTGQKIQTAAGASNMKVVHMELGGKSPAIIFDDANLESAAQPTQFSIRFLSGQTCMDNSRIYVQESVAERFLALFKEKYERAKSYLAIGEKDCKLSMGGDAGDGFFIKPTVFENVSEDSRTVREEVFGPVVVMNTFKMEAEAIEKANDSEFGLLCFHLYERSRPCCTVVVNCTSPSTAKDMPFGGYKMSDIGRKAFMHSFDGFLEKIRS
ncbi:Aldehyde/histidinol dehydrogenase [Aspergillus cavernicola]|uniref:aldehyde dehydrogenase (NAD(+)) n=1 Tax=Aspergillus cavernicola TaxID=176166 RepID=A0ABR4IHW5_9EURO